MTTPSRAAAPTLSRRSRLIAALFSTAISATLLTTIVLGFERHMDFDHPQQNSREARRPDSGVVKPPIVATASDAAADR